MQHISSTSLSTSLPSRLSYVQSFLAFEPSDGSAIQASAPLLKPLIPTVLDGIYTKLLSYDITAAAFVPKLGHELDASSEPQSPTELTLQHPHIRRQMHFLRGYIIRVAGNSDWSPEAELWTYLDRVAVMHTGSPGFKHRERRPELRVEFTHLALLLGYLEDMIVGAVMGMEEVDLPTRLSVVRAWNKLLWIQNDLFAKHYMKGVEQIGRDTKSALGEKIGWLGSGIGRDVVIAIGGGLLAALSVGMLK
ncbi:hypothetical protein MMC10_008264 [Thelotrema lepadinum]|nr:hypothetical protein [Thelotrema lepadinum]